MAKNVLGKVIAGIAIIGAGVAVGLTIYNKIDEISRDLDDDDEFEDDFDDFYDEDDEPTYVTLNTTSEAKEEATADNADTEKASTDEATAEEASAEEDK